MDNKHIEQGEALAEQQVRALLERYFNAETSLEEESMLRDYFSREDVPADLLPWRELFCQETECVLGDDFDARILEAIVDEAPVVKAREITLTRRLMPLFKAAAAIAIILTIGGALQAPFDNTWNTPEDYASYQQPLDSVAADSPIQAENITVQGDSAQVLLSGQSQ